MTGRFEDGELLLDLTPRAELLHHGVVRASVISFWSTRSPGISVDGDADVWTLTTDVTVRMRPVPAPSGVTPANTMLRGDDVGHLARSSHRRDGTPVGTGAIGFATHPPQGGDPPKPIVPPEQAPTALPGPAPAHPPAAEEAGIEVIDAAEGVVQVEVTPELPQPGRHPEGAMVALRGRGRGRGPGGHALQSPAW